MIVNEISCVLFFFPVSIKISYLFVLRAFPSWKGILILQVWWRNFNLYQVWWRNWQRILWLRCCKYSSRAVQTLNSSVRVFTRSWFAHRDPRFWWARLCWSQICLCANTKHVCAPQRRFFLCRWCSLKFELHGSQPFPQRVNRLQKLLWPASLEHVQRTDLVSGQWLWLNSL